MSVRIRRGADVLGAECTCLVPSREMDAAEVSSGVQLTRWGRGCEEAEWSSCIGRKRELEVRRMRHLSGSGKRFEKDNGKNNDDEVSSSPGFLQ